MQTSPPNNSMCYTINHHEGEVVEQRSRPVRMLPNASRVDRMARRRKLELSEV